MKRSYAKTVGEIFNELLRQERLDEKFSQQQALSLWPKIVGPYINRNTTNRSVKDGVITVTVTSAPLRNELLLSRSSLISRINEELGKEIIKEIIFR